MVSEKNPESGVRDGYAVAEIRQEYTLYRGYGRSLSQRLYSYTAIGLVTAAGLVALTNIYYAAFGWNGPMYPISNPSPPSACAQAEILSPKPNQQLDASLADLVSPAGESRSASLLSQAVQYDTSSYDDTGDVTGPSADPRWDSFPPFHRFLERTFPVVWEKANVEEVNKHALLIILEGEEPALKPSVLMAHQDVVPVNYASAKLWSYPPFSGAIQNGSIWGRGACDCKSSLIAILEALEALLNAGFSPHRTLVLSFGFDEETTGFKGAGQLANVLLGKYGKNGIEVIIDEGGSVKMVEGKPWAIVGVGEKGYLDVNITIHTPGGHSSVPPPHTGIGLLAELITRLEAAPFTPSIPSQTWKNPYVALLECRAAHAPSTIPYRIRRAIANAAKSGKARRTLLAWITGDSGPTKAEGFLIQTTQAVDVVRGGVKVNALPEVVWATVNHRIDTASSVAEVQEHTLSILRPFAQQYGLTLDAFGERGRVEEGAGRGRVISVEGLEPLEPAPISPATPETSGWNVLAGTFKHVYGEDGIVAPSLGGGNTDTHFYWNLTQNIYRFNSRLDDGSCEGIHTVNERITIEAQSNAVQFYYELIRNLSEM